MYLLQAFEYRKATGDEVYLHAVAKTRHLTYGSPGMLLHYKAILNVEDVRKQAEVELPVVNQLLYQCIVLQIVIFLIIVYIHV